MKIKYIILAVCTSIISINAFSQQEKQLEEFENYIGVYIGEDNTERIINADETSLYLTRPGAKHWRLKQQSTNEFITNDEKGQFTIKFIYDKTGKANEYQVIENGKIISTKKRITKNVPEKNIIILSDKQYNKFIGTYRIFLTLRFDVKKGNNCLIVEDPDGKPWEFYPLSNLRFFNKEYENYVEFIKNETGEISEMIFYRDKETRAKRVR